jgi:2',3'-cyclic-nucleotide 2'-phosphodiesterase/3'-nucleotidase
MDAIGYDGGTAGNHEFNYGLPFLSQVTGTPMNVDGGHTQHAPVRIIRWCWPTSTACATASRSSSRGRWSKTIERSTPDGSKVSVPLKIGIIGFTPPPIMQWDKQNLQARSPSPAWSKRRRNTCRRFKRSIPTGRRDSARRPRHRAVHAGYGKRRLVSGRRAGHRRAAAGSRAHRVPGPRYARHEGCRCQRGFVRGVPAVMGGFFGKDLGVIQLALNRQQGIG